VDLATLPLARREAEARRLGDADAGRAFDLAAGPVLRTSLLRLDARDHVLLVTVHHIAFDGWSLDVFFHELTALYEAFAADRPSPLPELALQYPEFARQQRAALDDAALRARLAAWKESFGTDLPVLRLPTDRPRPAVQTSHGAYRTAVLAAELSAALRALSQRSGATLFMTLLAAFQALLARWSGQERIVVGTPVAGRDRAEHEGMIGFFVNTLVLPLDVSGDPSFRGLLARARSLSLAGMELQDVPFDKLVEELQPQRDRSRSPLFQVMFSMHHLQRRSGPPPATDGAALAFMPYEAGVATAQFDLTLVAEEGSAGIVTGVEYNTDLFSAATMDLLLAHYRALLAAAVDNPEARLSELPPAAEELPRPTVVSAPAVPAPDADARRDRLAARMSKLTAAQREALEKKLRGGGAP
jgi:hypothetical protein